MTGAPARVLIAGGGVAGLEAALALRSQAEDRVATTLVADATHFTYRPLSVGEPFGGAATVRVVYRGSVPDLFRVGRHVVVDGRLRHGSFVAVRDSLVTKCPSKYAGAKKGS
jgi:NADH dehydrogenase FAD-containing subunit